MKPNSGLSLSGSGQEIFDALRNDIVFGRLNPRERLIETELVQRFHLHRAAVREALVALEQAGLVDRQRNKGASVLDLKPEHVEQLYAVRLLLETTAVGSIPLPLNTAAMETLVAIQEDHQQAVTDNDLQRVFEHNNRFHRHLYMQSGNAVLVELIDQCATRALTVRFHPYMDRSFLERVCEDHWAMIDACRTSDRTKLIALVREHLPLAKSRYLDTYGEFKEKGGVLAPQS
ncbi:GntR family transcriptional regulator [Mesorhizobium sp. INR15]|uniref:GntR family transcriptional regulator n=1 Tax=Mesorhizobium sp. INR15 TaxID=2654248 RepID=UPI00189646E2|nr:GntR family transcriptional regulator [Mesorhizobium sp. INR15]QPC95534.1 FCD domain-containing protein [Mesorhizobium sp. INR15]